MFLLIKKQPTKRVIRHFVYRRSLGPSFLLIPQMVLDYVIAFCVGAVQHALMEGAYQAFAIGVLFLLNVFLPPSLTHQDGGWFFNALSSVMGVLVVIVFIMGSWEKASVIVRQFRRSKITYSDQED